jgi:hypothetical protein
VAADLAALIAEAVKRARVAQEQAQQRAVAQSTVVVRRPVQPAPPPPPAPSAPSPSAGAVARAQQAAAAAAAPPDDLELFDATSLSGPASGLGPAPVAARPLLRAFSSSGGLLAGIVLSEALSPPVALRDPSSSRHW